MPVVLITGANRGIGYQHALQYAERGWDVHACMRQPSIAAELQALSKRYRNSVHLHQLDVTDHVAVDALAAKLKHLPVDVLLNNAGTFGPSGAPEGMAYQSLTNMDYGIWRQMLEVNLLAPFKVAAAFRDHLAAGERKVLVMMSSGLASIAENSGQSYAYRSSKAGLNMLTTGMAAEWRDLIVVAMAPGWCKTELGGMDAPIEPADSVRDQQQLYDRLTSKDSGHFLDPQGVTVPW